MAYKVTIEKVASGTISTSAHQLKTLANLPDSLPVEIIIEEAAGGLSIANLKAVLQMGIKLKMATAISAITGTPSLNACLTAGHNEHVDPVV